MLISFKEWENHLKENNEGIKLRAKDFQSIRAVIAEIFKEIHLIKQYLNKLAQVKPINTEWTAPGSVGWVSNNLTINFKLFEQNIISFYEKYPSGYRPLPNRQPPWWKAVDRYSRMDEATRLMCEARDVRNLLSANDYFWDEQWADDYIELRKEAFNIFKNSGLLRLLNENEDDAVENIRQGVDRINQKIIQLLKMFRVDDNIIKNIENKMRAGEDVSADVDRAISTSDAARQKVTATTKILQAIEKIKPIVDNLRRKINWPLTSVYSSASSGVTGTIPHQGLTDEMIRAAANPEYATQKSKLQDTNLRDNIFRELKTIFNDFLVDKLSVWKKNASTLMSNLSHLDVEGAAAIKEEIKALDKDLSYFAKQLGNHTQIQSLYSLQVRLQKIMESKIISVNTEDLYTRLVQFEEVLKESQPQPQAPESGCGADECEELICKNCGNKYMVPADSGQGNCPRCNTPNSVNEPAHEPNPPEESPPEGVMDVLPADEGEADDRKLDVVDADDYPTASQAAAALKTDEKNVARMECQCDKIKFLWVRASDVRKWKDISCEGCDNASAVMIDATVGKEEAGKILGSNVAGAYCEKCQANFWVREQDVGMRLSCPGCHGDLILQAEEPEESREQKESRLEQSAKDFEQMRSAWTQQWPADTLFDNVLDASGRIGIRFNDFIKGNFDDLTAEQPAVWAALFKGLYPRQLNARIEAILRFATRVPDGNPWNVLLLLDEFKKKYPRYGSHIQHWRHYADKIIENFKWQPESVQEAFKKGTGMDAALRLLLGRLPDEGEARNYLQQKTKITCEDWASEFGTYNKFKAAQFRSAL